MISRIFRLAYNLVMSSPIRIFSVHQNFYLFVEHVNMLSKSALYS